MTAVLGIDPSLTGTGIAAPTPEGSPPGTECSTVTTTAKTPQRLDRIYAAVREAADQALRGGDVVAVLEDLPTHAHGAGKTGMAQGVVRLALDHAGVEYVTVTAATLKKFATGTGNADKTRMQMEAFKRAGVEFADDNQCDAWWLRQLGLHLHQRPDALPLPQTHLDALKKVTTP